MKTICCMPPASAVALTLLCVTATAEPLSPVKEDAWSFPVGQLSGRLRVADATITTNQYFQLTLELSNQGHTPLAVESRNPHIFTIKLFDLAGKQIQPTSVRADTLYMSQWGVIPSKAYLGFPVSNESLDGAKGSHLDIGTVVWKLSPGTYRILGAFSSGFVLDPEDKPVNAKIWEGELELPAVEIEVVEKK